MRPPVCPATIALVLGVFCALLVPSDARGEELVLTRERVAQLIQAAPAARVAQFEAQVFGAAVSAAGVLSTENPVLSALGGVRFNPDGRRLLAGQANLAWPIDLGGQRGARIDAAQAEHRAALATMHGRQRRSLLGALLQHQLVLRDEREVAIAEARHALSERFHAAAQRRLAAGGVPELDVALAAMQERQDASIRSSAAGAREVDRLVLSTLLGLAPGAVVAGALVPETEPPPLAELEREIQQQAEVRAAAASLEAAQARAARARAARFPTMNLLAQYERDDGANIGLVGLSVPLPILNANRADVATSAAEVEAARARVAESMAVVGGQLQQSYARYLATKSAMEVLAPTEALATRAVSLATRGYELGENDLSSVLLVRREAIEVQAALLEASHTHSAVKIELLVLAGRVPR
ncbi:MAG TPA: TolC family protein [Polyangiaceae bacterium]|nr:TolC family protein [Polyangiaceae bacterium]